MRRQQRIMCLHKLFRIKIKTITTQFYFPLRIPCKLFVDNEKYVKFMNLLTNETIVAGATVKKVMNDV